MIEHVSRMAPVVSNDFEINDEEHRVERNLKKELTQSNYG